MSFVLVETNLHKKSIISTKVFVIARNNVTSHKKIHYNMDYIPKPLDTSDIVLPDGLEELTESLSKNIHEVWAAGRITAGWKYGPVRDDIKKEHPCLIPYEKLSEEEKDYDRSTAISTIKFIISRGAKIIM